MNLGPIAKTVTAEVTALIGWAYSVAASPGGFGHMTAIKWIGLAVAFAIGFGVYQVPNQEVSA